MLLPGCSEQAPVVDTRVLVESAPPVVQDVDVKLRYPVELQADEAVSITPVAVSGFLRRVLVDVGDKVSAGQLIALVDCREYAAKRTQAETVIAKRRAQVDESRSKLDRLTKMGEGLVAPAELDRAEADARVAEAELADAKAKLSEAGQRQGYCSMTAPFGGFVTERFLDPGAMVGPGGQPVVKLVKSRDVRVVASIIEEDAPKVSRGAPVEVVLHAYPDNPFTAEVARIGRALDPATRTLRVEMAIPQSTDVMLPGMTGKASLVISTNEDAMLVPFTAVLKLEEVAYVYVVRDEQGVNRARRVEVELGVDLGDWLEITSGITPEDRVIFVGRDLVDDGTEVDLAETVAMLDRPQTTRTAVSTLEPPGEPEVEEPAVPGKGKGKGKGKDKDKDKDKVKAKAKPGADPESSPAADATEATPAPTTPSPASSPTGSAAAPVPNKGKGKSKSKSKPKPSKGGGTDERTARAEATAAPVKPAGSGAAKSEP
ncbi:MAG: efflux RND transporter periplasmic adaptor subunit [Myxococcota bacterium]